MRRVLALRSFAAVLLAIGVFPLANVLTDGQAVPWYKDVAQEWMQRGAILVTLVIVVAAFAGSRLDDVLERSEAALLRPSSRTFGLVAAGAALVLAAIVSMYAFAGQPFTTDEMAQAWQARILASGHLSAVVESPREFFNTAPVLDAHGQWFSQYPVGGPAFIALGALVGAPWLVNPVLIAIATLALYRFFAKIGSELRARIATVLFVLSPMVLEMAGSQMNHVAALAFAVLALWSVVRWEAATVHRDRMMASLLTGLSLGIVATVRPLDAVIVAVIIGAVQVAQIIRDPLRWRGVAVAVIAGAVPVALLLWVNARTTGSPLLFGYEALNGPEHGIGFHVDPNGDMHTPLRGLIMASGYLMKLDMYLFEWPLPAVLVIAAGVYAVAKPTRWDLLLAALFGGCLVAYGAYWFDGFFAGPRFLFTAMPAFVYFAARMPEAAQSAHPVLKRAAALVIPICLAMAWIGPWGASSASSRIALYRDQRTKLKTPIEEQVRTAGIHNALVFVNEGWRGELLTRLRVLGASQFMADRLATTLDACGLQTALDAEALSADPAATKLARVVQRAQSLGVARPVPNLPGDQSISLVPGTSPTPRCLAAFSRDSLGTMPYAMFLARQTVGVDGRIGGDVVFARDLGDRNEELRARFGDRKWYRYRPAVPPASATFLPYR